eukprot:218618_1
MPQYKINHKSHDPSHTMRTSFIISFFAVLIGTVVAFAPVHRNAIPSPSTALQMKVVSSIGAMKKRSTTCQVVRRRGRIYVIDKANPRNKVRQGGAKMKKRRRPKS